MCLSSPVVAIQLTRITLYHFFHISRVSCIVTGYVVVSQLFSRGARDTADGHGTTAARFIQQAERMWAGRAGRDVIGRAVGAQRWPPTHSANELHADRTRVRPATGATLPAQQKKIPDSTFLGPPVFFCLAALSFGSRVPEPCVWWCTLSGDSVRVVLSVMVWSAPSGEVLIDIVSRYRISVVLCLTWPVQCTLSASISDA